MITELRIRDLVTVADVSLQLGPGLNALTGETGAGKSMLIDALGLLLGGRADTGAIRPGAARTVVEAVFEPVSKPARRLLEELGLDADDDRVVVRREVSGEGRSRAWVNGSPTTVGALEQLGGILADLHGQHQTVSLLRSETQRGLLDGYAGAAADAQGVAIAHADLARIIAEETALVERREAARRKADYLEHVVKEIDAARIVAGEEPKLDHELGRLRNVEELRALGERIGVALDGEPAGGALGLLHQAERALQQLERLDPAAADWRTLIDAGYLALEELARSAREYARGLDDDPARLRELESRRQVLDRLCRKYGETVEAVMVAREEAAHELELLDQADFDLKSLATRRAALAAALETAAKALSDRRRVGGDRLARAVNRALPKLGLAGGRFTVVLEPATPIGSTGAETVQFAIQLNEGLESRAIHRAASGGELSRLMLALTLALARQDGIPTLVFDEIDQGVGGEVGAQLAGALSEVGQRHQVLVVTHLPTIAARADRHLVVAKRTKAGIATSDVETVRGEDRVSELARMLGDADAETARRHAMALLNPA